MSYENDSPAQSQEAQAATDALIASHMPGIEGAGLLLADHPELLTRMDNIVVPNHESFVGRIVGVQDTEKDGRLVAVHWQTEKDGKLFNAVRAFKMEDVLAANPPETEAGAEIEVIEQVAELAGHTAVDAERVEQAEVTAVSGAIELLGLEPDTDAETVERALAARVSMLDPQISSLKAFERDRRDITEGMRKIVAGTSDKLDPVLYTKLEKYLAGSFAELEGFIVAEPGDSVTERLLHDLSKESGPAIRLRRLVDAMGSPTNPGQFDTDMLKQAHGALSGLEGLRRRMESARNKADQLQKSITAESQEETTSTATEAEQVTTDVSEVETTSQLTEA